MCPTSVISPDDPIYTAVKSNFGSKSFRALPYPSPYFDLAQTYLPLSIKEMFLYCNYFYNTHCIVPAAVNKLAAYPITDMVYSTKDDQLKDKWQYVFSDILNMPFQLFQANIDTFVFGNCFLGYYFPFKRYLVCNSCHAVNSFSKVKGKKAKGKKLVINGKCPSCDQVSTFEIKDKYVRDVTRIRIIRYDPNLITLIADPVSGYNKYLWDPPNAYRDAIKSGDDWDLFEHCPEIVLDAIREDKLVRLNEKNLFHMRRPSLSGNNSSWGIPLIMPALKALYYLQVLKQAQEAIAVQHIVPLWVLFPQGGTTTQPVSALANLGKWKATLEDELAKWRKDKNYIPIFNFPIGFENIGGEGKGLLLAPEIKQEIENVIVSMGVPIEFVFGGLTWTGSSITLRMLENTFTGIRDGIQRFIRFSVNLISKFMSYGKIDIYMSELKMADDVQRQQIAMNLEAAGKISTTRLLDEFGYDFKEEEKNKKAEFPQKMMSMMRDMLMQAKVQGEAGMVSGEYQVKAQIAQQEMMAESGMVPPAGAGAGAAPQDPNAAGAQGQQVDPNTGLPIDPETGLPIDPNTGAYVNPQTGQMMTEQEVQQYMAEMQGQQAAPAQPAEAQQQSVFPDQETAQANEAEAQQGLMGQMPPSLKSMITRYATSLIFMDQAQQQQILMQMQTETPTLATLVKQRMMDLTQLDPAINQPQQPEAQLPAALQPTTVQNVSTQ